VQFRTPCWIGEIMISTDTPEIFWRLHLKSAPDTVFLMLSTNEGRARFWAESAFETDGDIEFRFPNGQCHRGRVIDQIRPTRFVVQYIGGSITTFDLEDDGSGGTVLMLRDCGVSEQERVEVTAGWVSVLMALKAAVDYGIDLRNHDERYSWERGYADN
jgi:hypothetical protein